MEPEKFTANSLGSEIPFLSHRKDRFPVLLVATKPFPQSGSRYATAAADKSRIFDILVEFYPA